MLTDEQRQMKWREGNLRYTEAKIAEACAERDARIAELEKECDRLETYWNKCLADCKNIAERDARINELERQLAELRDWIINRAMKKEQT